MLRRAPVDDITAASDDVTAARASVSQSALGLDDSEQIVHLQRRHRGLGRRRQSFAGQPIRGAVGGATASGRG